MPSAVLICRCAPLHAKTTGTFHFVSHKVDSSLRALLELAEITCLCTDKCNTNMAYKVWGCISCMLTTFNSVLVYIVGVGNSVATPNHMSTCSLPVAMQHLLVTL